MWLTGDEPRYVSSGLAMFTNGSLIPSADVWHAFLVRSGLPIDAYPYAAIGSVRAQSLAPGSVFGFALVRFGLAPARWLNLAIGSSGIVALGMLLGRLRGDGFAAISPRVMTIAIVALSIPFVAYTRLLYPEILLFTTIAFALYALATKRWVPLAITAGLMPLEHVRALPLSLTFACIASIELIRARTPRSIVPFLATYGGVSALWCVVQFHAYGIVLGPAFSSTTPTLAAFAPRLTIALFDARHGLLTYAPIFLIALAGLALGAVRGDVLCRQCVVLLCAYVGTFMWSSAGESWSARFWVAALPMLAVGLCYALGRVTSLRTRAIAGALGAITLTNTCVYVVHPMWYLVNRTRSIAYDVIGSYVHLDIASLFPLDSPASQAALPSTPAMMTIACASIVIIALLLDEPAVRTVPMEVRSR